jgi:hypothetical protein
MGLYETTDAADHRKRLATIFNPRGPDCLPLSSERRIISTNDHLQESDFLSGWAPIYSSNEIRARIKAFPATFFKLDNDIEVQNYQALRNKKC